MSGARRASVFAFVLLATILSACAGARVGQYTDALHDWRTGHRAAALARAEVEYARWRDGNDLDESSVRARVDAANEALAERPIVARRMTAPPEMAPDAPPATLSNGIRDDLLSSRITAVLRATATVRGQRLHQHAPELLTVVFQQAPIAADGGLLDDVDTALRSVVAKRAALDALEILAAPGI